MSTKKLSNISLKDFRTFLFNEGLSITTNSKGRGGHEKWTRRDLDRPITIQTHITPIPERIVKQTLRHLNMSREEFFAAFKNKSH